MAFKALADIFFGNKIGFKKKKSLLRRNTPYYYFFGPPNFRKRGISLERFTTQMLQPTHFRL